MKYVKSYSGKIVEGDNYSKEVLATDVDMISSNALAQIIIINPKTTVADHYHKQTTEIFYFISGEVVFVVDGQETVCNSGDLLICEKDEVHEVRNASDTEARYLAVKTQAKNDTFWCD